MNRLIGKIWLLWLSIKFFFLSKNGFNCDSTDRSVPAIKDILLTMVEKYGLKKYGLRYVQVNGIMLDYWSIAALEGFNRKTFLYSQNDPDVIIRNQLNQKILFDILNDRIPGYGTIDISVYFVNSQLSVSIDDTTKIMVNGVENVAFA